MNPKLSSAILLLAAALFLIPTALYNFDTDANQGYQVVEEVILGPDNTFYYYSGNCEGSQGGIGTYSIEKDTLKLTFNPDRFRNEHSFSMDSVLANDENKGMITIEIAQRTDFFQGSTKEYFGKAIICSNYYDNDSNLISIDYFIANSDTIISIKYPQNTDYFNINVNNNNIWNINLPSRFNKHYSLIFNANHFVNNIIYNNTKHFYINKKQTNKINQPILITQEQDTLVIQPIK